MTLVHIVSAYSVISKTSVRRIEETNRRSGLYIINGKTIRSYQSFT